MFAGIWIDMNEPSVFDQDETTMPRHLTHTTKDGDEVLHRDVHNAYGLLMAKATYEGLLSRDNYQVRPFVLTRSAFFGTQKYAFKWTGDNRATIAELSTSINQILTLGVTGIPFTGADIPGFYGQPTEELFILFYQLGTFFPFMRAHGHLDFNHREPYLQSERVQRAIKAALNLRYDLAHYLYLLAYESSTLGVPIVRPMWYEYPRDNLTFGITDQFMFGSALLAAPKVEKGQYIKENRSMPCSYYSEVAKNTTSIPKMLYQRMVHLPRDNQGRWYFYETGDEIDQACTNLVLVIENH